MAPAECHTLRGTRNVCKRRHRTYARASRLWVLTWALLPPGSHKSELKIFLQTQLSFLQLICTNGARICIPRAGTHTGLPSTLDSHSLLLTRQTFSSFLLSSHITSQHSHPAEAAMALATSCQCFLARLARWWRRILPSGSPSSVWPLP